MRRHRPPQPHSFPRSAGVAWRPLARTLVLLAPLLIALTSAATASAAAPTATPRPTDTPAATQTPYPTSTPAATYTPYPSPTVTHRPALTLSVTSGVTGTTLAATASDFPPNGTVTLYWDKTTTVVGRDGTDDSGLASIDVTIPTDATPGGHTIKAVGPGRTSAGAPFTVARPQGIVDNASPMGAYCTGLLNWCPNLGDMMGSLAAAAWSSLTAGLDAKLQGATDSIISPLVTTPDLRGNQELTRVQGVLSQDATEAIVVLFGIAAMWCAKPSFFGEFEQGLALLLRSALVVAALRTLNLLLTTWTDLVNAMALDVGHANIANTGHTVSTWLISPLLVVLAGLERSVSLYTLGITYVLAPIFIVLLIWPPAHRLFMAWLFLFISTSTMGLAYSLATTMIVAMGVNAPSIWGAVMTVGGLIFLTLVPLIWGGLTLAAAQNGGGALSKVVNVAKMAVV